MVDKPWQEAKNIHGPSVKSLGDGVAKLNHLLIMQKLFMGNCEDCKQCRHEAEEIPQLLI